MNAISKLFVLLLAIFLLLPQVCMANNFRYGNGILFFFAAGTTTIINFFLILINLAVRKRWLRIVCTLLMLPQFWLMYVFCGTMLQANILVLLFFCVEFFCIYKSSQEKKDRNWIL